MSSSEKKIVACSGSPGPSPKRAKASHFGNGSSHRGSGSTKAAMAAAAWSSTTQKNKSGPSPKKNRNQETKEMKSIAWRAKDGAARKQATVFPMDEDEAIQQQNGMDNHGSEDLSLDDSP